MQRFNCPHCGKRLKVPPEWAGRPGRCPKCSNAITIPGDPKVPEASDSLCPSDDAGTEVPESEADDSAPVPRRRRHWRIHPFGVSLVAGLGVLLIIVLVVVVRKHNRNAEARANPQPPPQSTILSDNRPNKESASDRTENSRIDPEYSRTRPSSLAPNDTSSYQRPEDRFAVIRALLFTGIGFAFIGLILFVPLHIVCHQRKCSYRKGAIYIGKGIADGFEELAREFGKAIPYIVKAIPYLIIAVVFVLLLLLRPAGRNAGQSTQKSCSHCGTVVDTSVLWTMNRCPNCGRFL